MIDLWHRLGDLLKRYGNIIEWFIALILPRTVHMCMYGYKYFFVFLFLSLFSSLPPRSERQSLPLDSLSRAPQVAGFCRRNSRRFRCQRQPRASVGRSDGVHLCRRQCPVPPDDGAQGGEHQHHVGAAAGEEGPVGAPAQLSGEVA